MRSVTRTVTTRAVVIALALAFGISTAAGAKSKAKPHQVLKGIGATVAEMKDAHGLARGPGQVCTAKDSCFGARVTDATSGKTYLFTSVDIASGLIVGYTQNFRNGTSLAAAEKAILRWFPADAVMGPLTVDDNGGSCGMFNITSPTLGTLFANPKVGDPQGVVGVELNYINANLNIVYDPHNVQEADVYVGPINPSDSC